jgi:hypothetical protein
MAWAAGTGAAHPPPGKGWKAQENGFCFYAGRDAEGLHACAQERSFILPFPAGSLGVTQRMGGQGYHANKRFGWKVCVGRRLRDYSESQEKMLAKLKASPISAKKSSD